MESHGEFGTETSQHPWSSMEKWYGDLSATMEYHEKSVTVDSLMECHEEFVAVFAHW